jgi:hypothetical protein
MMGATGQLHIGLRTLAAQARRINESEEPYGSKLGRIGYDGLGNASREAPAHEGHDAARDYGLEWP